MCKDTVSDRCPDLIPIRFTLAHTQRRGEKLARLRAHTGYWADEHACKPSPVAVCLWEPLLEPTRGHGGHTPCCALDRLAFAPGCARLRWHVPSTSSAAVGHCTSVVCAHRHVNVLFGGVPLGEPIQRLRRLRRLLLRAPACLLGALRSRCPAALIGRQTCAASSAPLCLDERVQTVEPLRLVHVCELAMAVAGGLGHSAAEEGAHEAGVVMPTPPKGECTGGEKEDAPTACRDRHYPRRLLVVWRWRIWW